MGGASKPLTKLRLVSIQAMVTEMKLDLGAGASTDAHAMAALAISVALLEGLSNEHARRIIGSALARLPQSNTTADKARRILDDLKP